MKGEIKIIFVIFLCIVSISANCQNKFSDFYKLIFYSQDTLFGFYPAPDSLKDNSKYSGFAQKLWAYNMYLYSIYSKAETEYPYLKSLIPDSIKIVAEHERILNEDQDFQNLFYATLNKKSVPDISIDSILIITSRFTYLHRLDNEIVIHMCVAINGLNDLPKTTGSPYYNAFGFMIQYSDECSQIIERIKKEYKNDIDQVKKTLNEEKIIEIRTKIYEALRKDNELHQLVLREYLDKKDYLNFRILY